MFSAWKEMGFGQSAQYATEVTTCRRGGGCVLGTTHGARRPHSFLSQSVNTPALPFPMGGAASTSNSPRQDEAQAIPPRGKRADVSELSRHGTEYKQIPVFEWAVGHVSQWVTNELAPVLDGRGGACYSEELCAALEQHEISGPLLLYLHDVATLTLQLQLDAQRWAARIHFVADAIRDLASKSSTLQAEPSTSSITTSFKPALLQPNNNTGKELFTDSRLHFPAAPQSPSASDKPYFVISYATQQADFKDTLSAFIEQTLGIEVWSGSDVLAGGGAGYWAEQWIRRADSDHCVAIIFILSRAFAQSPACKKEFAYVFGGRKANQVLPVMYELFEMQQWINFNLADVNYIQVTPHQAMSICTCQAKCACPLDCRKMDPRLAPNEDWHPNLIRACMDIAKLSSSQPIEIHSSGASRSIKRLVTMKASGQPQGQLSMEQRRDALMNSIAKEMGMDLWKLKMVGIIGSTSFFYKDSEAICQLIGQKLAKLGEEYCLVTGGFHGVGEAISKSFNDSTASPTPRLFHVLPNTDPQLEGAKQLSECALFGKCPLELHEGGVRFAEAGLGFGKVLRAGESIREREGIVACLPVLLLLEGGPGATNEAKSACKAKKYVVPVGVTGGAAHTFYHEGGGEGADIAQATGLRGAWAALGDGAAGVEQIAQAAVDLVAYLHDQVVGRERRRELAVGSEQNQPEKLAILSLPAVPDDGKIPSSEEILQTQLDQLDLWMSEFDGCYMLNGHGSKNQYNCSETELYHMLKPVIVLLNEKHGPGKWCCCYGGDPYQPDAPDVCHVARILYSEGVRIIAIQCDEYMDSILRPSHRQQYEHLSKGAVLFYPTTFHVDNNGLKHIAFGGKQLDQDGSMVLVGWSRVIFSKQVLKNIKGHLIVGGGAITRDDCEECLRHQVPLYYIRTEARNAPTSHLLMSAGKYYGEIDEWMTYRGFKQRAWI